ncbi:MAG TPA: fumarylacetoacetase [Bacteroidia bacterium]|jgi:fumarylacetoacetase|nr:fumarylacetoacetase [Bacteroidia bacterium]
MDIKANNPDLKSWIEVKPESDFPIQNIPFGVYKDSKTEHNVCIAIGDHIMDLQRTHESGYFNNISLPVNVFAREHLNQFISLGKEITGLVRNRISDLLNNENKELQGHAEDKEKIFKLQKVVTMLLPIQVGDYTDFYSSIDHATNIGKMLRDPDNALLPNWKHIPVGYHGRASSICVSGHSFHRPKGQTKAADAAVPSFGPTKSLDFELETAFIIGKKTEMGESISTENADEYIFGMTLFNDWSARDIQAWEYVPLGPFLAKNFASTVSPWIVTLEALEPFRVEGYKQEPKVLPYLEYKGNKNLDINLEVYIQPDKGQAARVCDSNYKFMYWTMEQQLTHHTVNGCNINVGDMMASGTISGSEKHQFGSMMELTWRGADPIKLSDGSERKFINDNDTVIMRGWCKKGNLRIGFGECAAKVLPAI